MKNSKVFVAEASWPGGSTIKGVFDSFGEAFQKIDEWTFKDVDEWEMHEDPEAGPYFSHVESGGEYMISFREFTLNEVVDQ